MPPAAGSISGAGSVQTRVEPRYLEIKPFESEDSGLFWLLDSLKGGVNLGSLRHEIPGLAGVAEFRKPITLRSFDGFQKR